MKTRGKRKQAHVFNAQKKYVFANGEFTPTFIPKPYTQNEIMAGLLNETIITYDTYKQRRLVYELDGSFVSVKVLADKKKCEQLQAEGVIITSSTYNNRNSIKRNSIPQRSITKIKNYDVALNMARQLTAKLPFPTPMMAAIFLVPKEIRDQLYAFPTRLQNEMGILTIRKKNGNNDYNVSIDIEQYQNWHQENSPTPLQVYSLFSPKPTLHHDFFIAENSIADARFSDLLGDGNPGEMPDAFFNSSYSFLSEPVPAVQEHQNTDETTYDTGPSMKV